MRHGEQIIIYLIEVKVVAYGINRHLYKKYFIPKSSCFLLNFSLFYCDHENSHLNYIPHMLQKWSSTCLFQSDCFPFWYIFNQLEDDLYQCPFHQIIYFHKISKSFVKQKYLYLVWWFMPHQTISRISYFYDFQTLPPLSSLLSYFFLSSLPPS